MPRIPLVSIILPTYNRGDRLSRAIDSVLNQSATDFELIVVDDGSTDHTATALNNVTDPRIVYRRMDANRGQSVARNLGIQLSKGEYIAFQDSDDEWVADKLAIQTAAITSQPHVAMVYGDLLRVPKTGEPYVISAPELVKGRLLDNRKSGYSSYGIGIQTCLFRAGPLKDSGGFDERMRCFEDLDLFLRITMRHATLKISGVMVRYYETGGVCAVPQHHYAARKRLFRRYFWRIAMERPSWLVTEYRRIRDRRPLNF